MNKHSLPGTALLGGLLLALSTATSPSLAGTNAYVGSGLLSGSVEDCLKDMKGLADKTGFTEAQEVVMSNDKKSGDFHADKKDSSLHLVAKCDPATGVWALAVSGIDNQQTYDEFSKAFDALP